MRKIYYLFYVLLVSFLFSCVKNGKLDNYSEPKETLKGNLIDEVTNKPLVTEQPNGFRIKLSEISWSDNPQPQYFWGKADGTFNNTKIFSGTYQVTPIEGAFFPVNTDSLGIKIIGVVNHDFRVTPYLSVTANTSVINNSLVVSYTISRPKVGDKIIDSRVFVSTNTNVGSNIFVTSLSASRNLRDIDDEVILNTTFNETISGFDEGTKIYYVRVGARTDNADKRYNFTEIVKMEITGLKKATNLALNKPSTASSVADPNTADKAVDGDAVETRWESNYDDPSWIYVDLGASTTVNRVVLKWEYAHADQYKIQVSDDANTWTDVYTETAGDGEIDDISFTATSARYVRMFGTHRATEYAYSIYEFEIYGL